jgi:hypothetical protein
VPDCQWLRDDCLAEANGDEIDRQDNRKSSEVAGCRFSREDDEQREVGEA